MATELRQTGINVVGDVPWGTHFCHFYETKQDLLDTLVPYFKAGLESNEFCLWVVSDSDLITVEEVKRALAQAMPDLDRHLSDGNIEILKGPDWYLEKNVFSLERVTSAWDAKLKRALAQGYDGMRVSGDTFWLAQKDWKDFFAYEKQLNDWIVDQPMTVLCTYPLAKSGAADVLDVVQAHQFAIARRQGEWEVIETPELIQAKAEIKRLNEELEQRVVERTGQLARAIEELTDEISDRKRSEVELSLALQRLSYHVENTPLAVIEWDKDLFIKRWSKRAEEVFGWKASEALGINMYDPDFPLVYEEDAQAVEEIAGQLMKGTVNRNLSLNRNYTKDGNVIYCEWYNSVLRDVDGNVITILSLVHDVTERQQAEASLHAKEQEFRAIVENAPDQIIRYDREFRRVYVNPAVARTYGLPAEALIGKQIGSVIQDARLDVKDDELAQLRQRIAAVFDTGKSCEFEITWPTPTGRKYYSARLFPELDLNGSVINVLGIARDITERKQAEEALDERLRFETLLTELSAAFANLTTNEVDHEIDKWLKILAGFLSVDRASFFQFEEDWTTLYRSHSYSVPGIEPLPPPPIVLKDQFPWITDQLRRGITVKWSRIPDDMAEEAAKEKEYATKRGVKSGLNIPVLMGGSIICAIAFTSIVSYRDWPDEMVARLRLVGEIFAAAVERKRAEGALREAEQKYRDIFENAGEGIFQSTPDGRYIAINPALARMYGFASPEELIHSCQDISRQVYVDPTRREEFKRQLEENGAVRGFEHEVFCKDGSRLWISVNARAVQDEQGAIQYYEGTVQDITERKAAEEKLKATSEQLRALSARMQSAKEEEGIRIAREIHDELGSALTSLRWDLETIEKLFSESGKQSQVPALRKKIAAMLEVTDGTLNSVRKIASELRPTALDDFGLVVGVRWQARQFQDRTGIVVHCDSPVDSVDLNQEQSTALFRIFQEALTNILRHAKATRVAVTMVEEAGAFVLTISDNGRGITEDEKSAQLSLGLVGMRERAHLIGAEIDIIGVEGEGTAVTVKLPIIRVERTAKATTD